MDQFGEDLVAALRDVVEAANWQCVGPTTRFSSPCTKLFSEDGDHMVLIHQDGLYRAMDASCPHEGGPLELGDIEDLGDGKLVLVCPWHHFDFCVETGVSSTGLQNNVYDVRVVRGDVFVNTPNALSLAPFPVTSATCTDVHSESSAEDSLCFWAAKILSTPDPMEKVDLTFKVQERWDSAPGAMEVGRTAPPQQPSRKEDLTVLQPGKIKRGREAHRYDLYPHQVDVDLYPASGGCDPVPASGGCDLYPASGRYDLYPHQVDVTCTRIRWM
ncbi:Rieske domain-containing protein [Merluccius polli]|uniref:Rieske domain-containing protein n=1 Tax=Merluccius polli TaxID=89951 RepID=A0AA47NNS9_MERPO|nr:Rieske domain-containing protein [Merluccius polli]